MRGMSLRYVALFGAFLLLSQTPADAQTALTPQQIQAQIASGQEATALTELKTILGTHPDSGVAWYLAAEAQDAAGNEAGARNALAKAEQYAPGLPFAQADKVAALQAHLATPSAVQHRPGVSPGTVIGIAIALLLLVFLFIRARRRVPYGYPNGYGPGLPGGPPGNPYPYSPQGGMSYGPGAGMPGVGSSLITGLAAGAGFAAGERIIDGVTGGSFGSGTIDPASGGRIDPTPPGRDDGLLGSPGWDDNNSGAGNPGTDDDGDDFDPGNNW